LLTLLALLALAALARRLTLLTLTLAPAFLLLPALTRRLALLTLLSLLTLLALAAAVLLLTLLALLTLSSAFLTLLALLTLLTLASAVLLLALLTLALPALLRLLALLSALLLLPPARGVVLGRGRCLRQDDRRGSCIIRFRQGILARGLRRSETGETRKNSARHQQTPVLFHMISYGCEVRSGPERPTIPSKRARAAVGCMIFFSDRSGRLVLHSGGLLTPADTPA
jgi:hypothetical protein